MAHAVFGGPKTLAADIFLESPQGLEDFLVAQEAGEPVAGFVIESAAVLSSGSPLSNILPSRDGLLIYKIQAGDNLSKIAREFDISLNTILWANPNLRSGLIRPGEELIILPVSGILHEVREGETIESIAGLYGITEEKILKINPKASRELLPTQKIIIPDGRPKRGLAYSPSSNLPNLNTYFALPTTGWNWGELHPINAVDIANACGTPVYAAAEGLVSQVGSPTNWNNGYGGLVVIEHPNRTETRYAHLRKIFISEGDYISQRELIGEIGNTGNVHGTPGCHLHFEVGGARNPLAK